MCQRISAKSFTHCSMYQWVSLRLPSWSTIFLYDFSKNVVDLRMTCQSVPLYCVPDSLGCPTYAGMMTCDLYTWTPKSTLTKFRSCLRTSVHHCHGPKFLEEMVDNNVCPHTNEPKMQSVLSSTLTCRIMEMNCDLQRCASINIRLSCPGIGRLRSVSSNESLYNHGPTFPKARFTLLRCKLHPNWVWMRCEFHSEISACEVRLQCEL